MRAHQFIIEDKNQKENIVKMFSDFFPLAMKLLNLDKLPKIYFVGNVEHDVQPSFGEYRSGEKILTIALKNRHPNDILRTVAHELVHFKQDLNGELSDPNCGATGSPQENEANSVAGIIMRNFNKQYPKYLSSKPI